MTCLNWRTKVGFIDCANVENAIQEVSDMANHHSIKKDISANAEATIIRVMQESSVNVVFETEYKSIEDECRSFFDEIKKGYKDIDSTRLEIHFNSTKEIFQVASNIVEYLNRKTDDVTIKNNYIAQMYMTNGEYHIDLVNLYDN